VLIRELRLIGVALQFLSRCPLPPAWLQPWQPPWLNDCVRHFPLVGALLGAAAGAVLWGAGQLWNPWIAALLALAFSAWACGGFHEDGLADTCDGLGGAVSRERALAIMKDSRIGSYGALGLLFVTALRVAALAALAARDLQVAAWALVWVGAAARWLPVALMGLLPYAGDAEHAKAKPLAIGLNLQPAGWALLWLLALAAALPLTVRAFALSAGVLLVLLCTLRAWLRRRLGGYTGDTLGASEQLAEAALLLALAA